MGVGTSAKIISLLAQRAIVLSAIIVIFVVKSVFGWLLHLPEPTEIVGEVWGGLGPFAMWRKGPVGGV